MILDLLGMKKNTEKFDITSVFHKIKEQVSVDDSAEPYMPDIIEFCYSKKYLNLELPLYPMQAIILKCFYRLQKGNEHIKLTESELELLHEYKLNSVLEKYYSGELFRELVLVLGRRSGKDYMVSLIALYEAMKLLEIPGGSPLKYYHLAPGNPIYILTVATAADQARILFLEIKAKLIRCDYFKNKVGGSDADRIYLLTPEDKKHNKQLIEDGMPSACSKGSVIIMCGHSNSDSLLGKKYWALLFDEVAAFKTTGGASGGERLYGALGPGTADFSRPLWIDQDGHRTTNPKDRKKSTPVLDGKGKQVRQLDSKMISISSPRAESGILYKHYIATPTVPYRLTFKLPTWKVNESMTEDMIRQEFKFLTHAQFQMEFGAEFSGAGGEKYIADLYIDQAIELGRLLGLEHRLAGRPGVIYYAHLDPSSSSHNYALVVLHVEQRIQITTQPNGVKIKEPIKLFVVDHLKVWMPSAHELINVKEVDNYIIDLAKRFRFGMVSYDNWNSTASIQKLRSKGIPTKMTPFRRHYMMAIYDQLEDLFINHQLALLPNGQTAELLQKELKCLKKTYTASKGFKITTDPEGAITTDDLADALAGAIGTIMTTTYSGYVKSGTVSMPQSRDGTRWNIGGATYSSVDGIYDKRLLMHRPPGF